MASANAKTAASALLGGDSLQPSSVRKGLNGLLTTGSSSPSSGISSNEGEAIVKNMISYMDGNTIKRANNGSNDETASLSVDDFQAISDQYIKKSPSTSESSSAEEIELFKLCLAHFNGNVQEMFTALKSNLVLTPSECSQITKFLNGN